MEHRLPDHQKHTERQNKTFRHTRCTEGSVLLSVPYGQLPADTEKPQNSYQSYNDFTFVLGRQGENRRTWQELWCVTRPRVVLQRNTRMYTPLSRPWPEWRLIPGSEVTVYTWNQAREVRRLKNGQQKVVCIFMCSWNQEKFELRLGSVMVSVQPNLQLQKLLKFCSAVYNQGKQAEDWKILGAAMAWSSERKRSISSHSTRDANRRSWKL